MPLLVLLLILVPIVELWAILQVGQLIGAGPTIALLIADSLLGAWLLRHQGRASWARFRLALASGRVPATETADGALVIFGAALLLTPGFLTDALGLALLIPPTRALVRRVVLRRVVTVGAASVGGPAVWAVRGTRFHRARPRRAARRHYDVEGTAVDPDQPALRTHE
jgi:UPF0716 protein FxsA